MTEKEKAKGKANEHDKKEKKSKSAGWLSCCLKKNKLTEIDDSEVENVDNNHTKDEIGFDGKIIKKPLSDA